MGFARWLEKRRIQKLEHINQEIEAMKKQGLNVPKVRPSGSAGGKPMHYVRKDSSLGLIAVICLCIIALVGVSLLFRSTYNELKERYSDEVENGLGLVAEVAKLRGQLNETSSKLKLKTRVEEELGEQYVDVTTERDSLKQQVEDLTTTVADKDSEIEQLVQDKQLLEKKIKKYENCITDDDILDSSLSVCD